MLLPRLSPARSVLFTDRFTNVACWPASGSLTGRPLVLSSSGELL